MAHNLTSLIIRKAKQADLLALEWGGQYIHFRRMYADAFRRSEMGETILWVADLQAGGLIGQVFVQLRNRRQNYFDNNRRGYIYAVRVHSVYRNKGVGTRMMNVAEEDLFKRGFGYATINVAQNNYRAKEWYQRLGYSVIGPDPGSWSYIDHLGKKRQINEPAWRMEKWIGKWIGSG